VNESKILSKINFGIFCNLVLSYKAQYASSGDTDISKFLSDLSFFTKASSINFGISPDPITISLVQVSKTLQSE
jgi:hypothetical protein